MRERVRDRALGTLRPAVVDTAPLAAGPWAGGRCTATPAVGPQRQSWAERDGPQAKAEVAMASAEWAHVPPAGGPRSRRLSVASSSTSLASGNRMLAAVHGTQLDASRRAREKQLNSQLLSQISQSPFARHSTTGSLSALSSPALVSHLAASKLSTASPRTDTLGLSGTTQTLPLSAGTSIGFGLSPGAARLQRAQYSSRRTESDGSTYLSYVVGEHKTRLGNVPGDYDDVDLDELAAQAARDQAASRGRPLGDPPVSAAQVPSPASLDHPRQREESEASGLALRLEPEPTAASADRKSASTASVPAVSAQPVTTRAVTSGCTNPPIVDQVAKPTSSRQSGYATVSTEWASLPPRTPSPTPSEEVPTDEIGGQWRKQFGDSNFTSSLEGDDSDAEQDWVTSATQNRCAVYRCSEVPYIAHTDSMAHDTIFSNCIRLRASIDSRSCAAARRVDQAAVLLATCRHEPHQNRKLCLRGKMRC